MLKKSYIPKCWFIIVTVLYLVGCTNSQPKKEGTVTNDSTYYPSADSANFIFPKDEISFNRLTTSRGQIVYIPVYSHIYQHNQQKTFNLTATLSFRNTDPYRNLVLTKVLYYDSKGNLIKSFLESQQLIDPLASTSYVVEEDDLRGGVGANFIVEWRSETPVNPPVIEAVMISTSQQQGISFLSTGRVLQEYSEMDDDTSRTGR